MPGVWEINTNTPQILPLIHFCHDNCASFSFINLHLNFFLNRILCSIYRSRVEKHYLSKHCLLELQYLLKS